MEFGAESAAAMGEGASCAGVLGEWGWTGPGYTAPAPAGCGDPMPSPIPSGNMPSIAAIDAIVAVEFETPMDVGTPAWEGVPPGIARPTIPLGGVMFMPMVGGVTGSRPDEGVPGDPKALGDPNVLGEPTTLGDVDRLPFVCLPLLLFLLLDTAVSEGEFMVAVDSDVSDSESLPPTPPPSDDSARLATPAPASSGDDPLDDASLPGGVPVAALGGMKKAGWGPPPLPRAAIICRDIMRLRKSI